MEVSMGFFENAYVSIVDAIQFFDSSIAFVSDLVVYLPSVLGSAVILFLTVYVIRFFLLKWGYYDSICFIY